MLWSASFSLDSSTPSFWASAAVSMPRSPIMPPPGPPRCPSMELPCWLPACPVATETLELSVGFGECESALASCVRPRPIPAVARTAAPPKTSFFIVGFPFRAGSSGHTGQGLGDRLSRGCGEPAGTVGEVVTGLRCGTGTYLHRMPEPRSPVPHGAHGAHRRRDRGRDPAPSSRAWRLPARGLPTARGETPGPASRVRAGRPAGRLLAHPVVTETSGWHLKRRGR